MVFTQHRICPVEWNAKTPLGSPDLGQTTRPSDTQRQKKRICQIVDFTVPADHRVKSKESEKKDKYLDIAREMKKL